MRSGDVLRHSVSIDEQEVFCLIHRPVELLELQPSRFAGRVALWAEAVERRYGDSINPVMTYVESGPHRVSWIHHEGEDWRSGERFCTYHIICDCITGFEGNSPQESVAHSLGCSAVLRALQRRAAFVDYKYRTGEIMAALRDPDTGDFEQSERLSQVRRRDDRQHPRARRTTSEGMAGQRDQRRAPRQRARDPLPAPPRGREVVRPVAGGKWCDRGLRRGDPEAQARSSRRLIGRGSRRSLRQRCRRGRSAGSRASSGTARERST